MARIRKVTQTTSKTTKVVANSYDGVIETVSLTDAADASFVFEVENNKVRRVSTVLLTGEYPALNGKTTRTVTLTGTGGTANVVVAGVNYLATFDTTLTQTATNFVTDHAATLLALGYTVTSSGAVLTFTADTTAFPTITVANVTTNLNGTLGTVTATASTGVPNVTLESYQEGSFNVRVTNVGTSAFNGPIKIAFKITHN
jgi:hypothetical protein